jgi:hypothetical protein
MSDLRIRTMRSVEIAGRFQSARGSMRSPAVSGTGCVAVHGNAAQSLQRSPEPLVVEPCANLDRLAQLEEEI